MSTGLKMPLALLCWVGLLYAAVEAQTPPPAAEKPSKNDLMIQVVRNPDTPLELRRANAQALLQDAHAHPDLIKIFQTVSDNEDVTARIIICQAIAALNDEPVIDQSVRAVPRSFIEPLFQSLLSGHTELSSWAAQALVKCHNGVSERLAGLVADKSDTPAHRMAGIRALELIIDSKAVLTLAKLLSDDNAHIRSRAATALSNMLYLPEPLDNKQFLNSTLPQLRKMNEPAFLLWLMSRQKARLRDVNLHQQQEKQETARWRERFFQAQTEKFDLLVSPDEKLKFLKGYLVDQQEDLLRIWALERINDWCKTASVRVGPIAQQLVELLPQFIVDNQPQVRRLTALSLAQLDYKIVHPTAEALLEQLKKETEPAVQAALLSALGTLESVPALWQALKLLAEDPVRQVDAVVQEAVRSVGKICGAKAEAISAEQIEQIAACLAQSYPRRDNSAGLRSEWVQAMRRIAEQEKFRPQAGKHFKKIMVQALDDPDPGICSPAVYALSELLGREVLPLLLTEPRNLLDNKDSEENTVRFATVRFAVVAAVEKFGGAEYLTPLRQRLNQETDPDVVHRIQGAFLTILESLGLDEIYQWALQLQTAGDKEELLSVEVVRILWDKITKAKAAGTAVELEHEKFALSRQAEIAEQKNLPLQTVKWYQKLLALKVPEEHKDNYRERIIHLAVSNDSKEILQAAQAAIAEVIKRRPTVLTRIARVCDALSLGDDKQLLRRAEIIAALIIPLPSKALPSPEVARGWQKRATETALALIEQQKKLLIETGNENPEAIKILARLDTRLTGYPSSDAPVEKRQEALEKLRSIIQSEPEKSDSGSDTKLTPKTNNNEQKKPAKIPNTDASVKSILPP